MAKSQKFTAVEDHIDGFVTVGAFSPTVYLGNPMENASVILKAVNKDKKLSKCDVVVTPELSLTGYTCQDMFFNSQLLNKVNDAIEYLKTSIRLGVVLSVGAPILIGKNLFNCSLLIRNNRVISITPKTFLANYEEFYEDRWFTAYDPNKHSRMSELGYWVSHITAVEMEGFERKREVKNFYIASEVCEDLWAADPISTHLALAGAEIIVNNSASNETVGKDSYRRDLVKMQSAKTKSVYIYCSAGLTESSQDMVFGGHNIIAENGKILVESDLFDFDKSDAHGVVVATVDLDIIRHDRVVNKTFSSNSEPKIDIKYTTDEITHLHKGDMGYFRTVSMTPFTPVGIENAKERCMSIFEIQVAGLVSRLLIRENSKLVIGVSGGLDSTLALLVAYEAMRKLGRDTKDIIGVTMPCFGTTSRTKDNAIELMNILGCTKLEVNIADSVRQHLKDIDLPETDRSVAFENAQARERTQVLMDIGNKVGGFVLGTGDMSELALGWCTYNGDQMSMYNPNGSIPKTLVRTLVDVIGHRLTNDMYSGVIDDILDTPVSPELLPPTTDGDIAQLTENSVGPYVFNDFFMFYHIRYGMNKAKILELAKIGCEQDGFDFDKVEYWLNKFYVRFFNAQFKRNPMPDGAKVGSVSLNPRGDWRCPTEFDSHIFKY